MDRNEPIHRASLAFLEYGIGAAVILPGDPRPLPVRGDEAGAQLSQWQAQPEIVEAMARATRSHDVEHEAIVVREDAIGFTASIERDEVDEVVGSVSCSVVNQRAASSRPTLPHGIGPPG